MGDTPTFAAVDTETQGNHEAVPSKSPQQPSHALPPSSPSPSTDHFEQEAEVGVGWSRSASTATASFQQGSRQPARPPEHSDLFHGTSQAYSHSTHWGKTPHHALHSSPNLAQSGTSNLAPVGASSLGLDKERESGSASGYRPEEYSLQQLEVLYRARGRKLEQLNRELEAQAEEAERHIRILRHEKVEWEGGREGEREEGRRREGGREAEEDKSLLSVFSTPEPGGR